MKNGFVIAAIISTFIFTFFSCCEKPVQGSTFFNFEYEGQSFRIRTVYSENKGFQTAGIHYLYWNGKDYKSSNVLPGIYFYRLMEGNHIYTEKLVKLE